MQQQQQQGLRRRHPARATNRTEVPPGRDMTRLWSGAAGRPDRLSAGVTARPGKALVDPRRRRAWRCLAPRSINPLYCQQPKSIRAPQAAQAPAVVVVGAARRRGGAARVRTTGRPSPGRPSGRQPIVEGTCWRVHKRISATQCQRDDNAPARC